MAFVFFPDNEHYLSVVKSIYPGGATGEVRSHAGGIHLFSTYVLSSDQAQDCYGVHLDVAQSESSPYRSRGRVDRVGILPPDVRGRVRARWSGELYLPASGAYHLALTGPPAQMLFDGRPGPPPHNAFLQAGWHHLVVKATLVGGDSLQLLLGESDKASQKSAAEVLAPQLWPAPVGAGLLGVVGGITARPAVPRVDSFVGFTAVGDPTVIGPALGAQVPLRARWTGELKISEEGAYTLEVRSDGAARLFLDGQDVAAVCATGESRRVPITLRLNAGWHPLRLDYVAQPGRLILELFWTRPGEERALIPPGALRFAADDFATRATIPVPPVAPDCSQVRPPLAAIRPAPQAGD